MTDFLFSMYRTHQAGFDVWICSLLGGLLRAKQSSRGYATPHRTIVEHTRLTLLWFFSLGFSYTDQHGQHLAFEARLGWASLELSFNLYPLLP